MKKTTKNQNKDKSEELQNCQDENSISDVIALQEQFKAASEKVDSLQLAISGQEEIKTKANSTIPSMQDLDKEKENLLAQFALGEATQKDLDEFDKKYTKELAATQKAKKNSESIISSANQTIAGLLRCLNKAEDELNELKTRLDSAKLQFLKDEIEKTGYEYLDLTKELTEKYKKIVGLEALIRSIVGKTTIRTANCGDFKIPMFNLEAFKEFLVKNPAGTYPEAEAVGSFHSTIVSSRENERERISKLGIDLK